MLLLDTNAILRYVLQDNQEMADIVEQLLSDNVCYIPVEVVAEIVFVLLKVYKIERKIIAQIINDIIETSNIRVAQSKVICCAVRIFAASSFDFVDCLLAGYAKEKQCSVFTFDKKIKNYLNNPLSE